MHSFVRGHRSIPSWSIFVFYLGKPYDPVPQYLLWEIMQKYRVRGSLLFCVCFLGITLKQFKMGVRLYQGCVLCPPLFVAFMDRILRCSQGWRGALYGRARGNTPVINRWHCTLGIIWSGPPTHTWTFWCWVYSGCNSNQHLQVWGHSSLLEKCGTIPSGEGRGIALGGEKYFGKYLGIFISDSQVMEKSMRLEMDQCYSRCTGLWQWSMSSVCGQNHLFTSQSMSLSSPMVTSCE